MIQCKLYINCLRFCLYACRCAAHVTLTKFFITSLRSFGFVASSRCTLCPSAIWSESAVILYWCLPHLANSPIHRHNVCANTHKRSHTHSNCNRINEFHNCMWTRHIRIIKYTTKMIYFDANWRVLAEPRSRRQRKASMPERLRLSSLQYDSFCYGQRAMFIGFL